MYFDHNTESPVHPEAVKATAQWLGQRSPQDGKERLLSRFREVLGDYCGCVIGDQPDHYWLYIMGSQREANLAIIGASIRGYSNVTTRRPHIVGAYGDDPELLDHCRSLEQELATEYTELPAKDGGPDLEVLPNRLKENTALATVSAANMSGYAMDIGEFARICKSKYRPVPSHVDISLIAGSTCFSVGERSAGERSVGERSVGERSVGERSVGERSVSVLNELAAFTLGFQQMGGPPGVVALAVKNQFREAFQLPIIAGEPNIPAVAGALRILRIRGEKRAEKNVRLARIRNVLWNCVMRDMHDARDMHDMHDTRATRSTRRSKRNSGSFSKRNSGSFSKRNSQALGGARRFEWVSPPNGDSRALPNHVTLTARNAQDVNRLAEKCVLGFPNMNRCPIDLPDEVESVFTISFSDDTTVDEIKALTELLK